MNRFKPFITICLLVALSLFTTQALAQGNDAELELRPSVNQAGQGDEISVDVILKNPAQQSVISVRAWLEYNQNSLEGIAVDTSDSPFSLAAPGEDGFNASEGRVKIGRSNISGGVTDMEAKVATVRFRVKTADPVTTTIGFYDYQVSELGHTSVNVMEQGFPVNILSEEPEDVTIELNPGAAPSEPDEPSPQPEPVEPAPQPDTGGGFVAAIPRPTDLRVNTGSGYASLKWEAVNDPQVTGYNIYYGKTSGLYTRRRSVGNVNQYILDSLMNGQAYYFAVTAYNSQSQESDYSDEAAIIINEPLSSTSPFEGAFDDLLARVPVQPQNGPLVGWLAFSALGLTGSVFFRKKSLSK